MPSTGPHQTPLQTPYTVGGLTTVKTTKMAQRKWAWHLHCRALEQSCEWDVRGRGLLCGHAHSCGPYKVMVGQGVPVLAVHSTQKVLPRPRVMPYNNYIFLSAVETQMFNWPPSTPPSSQTLLAGFPYFIKYVSEMQGLVHLHNNFVKWRGVVTHSEQLCP